jgi:hypothetical protein
MASRSADDAGRWPGTASGPDGVTGGSCGDPGDGGFVVSPPEPDGCARAAWGCGIIAAVVFLALLAVTIWVALSWKRWVVNTARQVAVDVVDRMPLEPDDRRRILAALDRVGDAFVAGRIDGEGLGRLLSGVVDGPLLPLAIVKAADAKYVARSGLLPDEQQAARRTLERAGRGLVQTGLGPEDFEELSTPIMEPGPRAPPGDDRWRLKERLTDDELRGFLARLKARIDEAGVPDEPWVVDVAAEVEKVVERGLAER